MSDYADEKRTIGLATFKLLAALIEKHNWLLGRNSDRNSTRTNHYHQDCWAEVDSY
jgi:hypothetical protein